MGSFGIDVFPEDLDEEVLIKEKTETWKLRKVNKTLKCRDCGSTLFEVGQGSYFTAIRCQNCMWEMEIHEG